MLRNLTRNAVRPGYLRVMTAKLVGRVTDRPHAAREREATVWAADRARPVDELARVFDPGLWAEAEDVGHHIAAAGRRQLAALEEDPHQGGAHAALLYFLVRALGIDVAVETGVALGHSTAAILSAMQVNGRGHLYSSDFPAFRHREPERHVGCLVDDDLRDRWTLDLRGDRRALRRFLAQVDRIDLLHYDSDKTYRARRRAVDLVEPLLSPHALVLIDDIQDNFHFRDYVEARTVDCDVVDYDGKYLGVVGLPGSGERDRA